MDAGPIYFCSPGVAGSSPLQHAAVVRIKSVSREMRVMVEYSERKRQA